MDTFGVEAQAVHDLGLRDAKDREIYLAARGAGAIVVTKDSDFRDLREQHGSPPQIVWITCGNTSNAHLRSVLSRSLPVAPSLLERSEPLVEIGDAG